MTILAYANVIIGVIILIYNSVYILACRDSELEIWLWVKGFCAICGLLWSILYIAYLSGIICTLDVYARPLVTVTLSAMASEAILRVNKKKFDVKIWIQRLSRMR